MILYSIKRIYLILYSIILSQYDTVQYRMTYLALKPLLIDAVQYHSSLK